MKAVRLLSLKVQPTFVVVDTVDYSTQAAPSVAPIELPASAVDNLPMLLTEAHRQMEQHLTDAGLDIDPLPIA